jgi:hypothetical protein
VTEGVFVDRFRINHDLDALGASTILRIDVVKDAQLVLNLPTPLKAFDEPGKSR